MYEKLEQLTDFHCTLGECPTWDERTRQLYFVDIPSKAYYAMNYASGAITKTTVDEMLGCMALCENGDVLLGMESGVFRRTADGVVLPAHPPTVLKGARFNDGKIGVDGTFYVGTAGSRGEAAFYRLDDGKLEMLFDGCSCSNGLDWTEDGSTMFYCDTLEHRVERFDVIDGKPANRRTVLELPKENGWPDGMTIDRAGRLWLALWNGYGVVCIDPVERKILRRIDLPIKQVTSCAFAGEDLRDLIITTAAQGQDLDKQPQAGYVFRVRCDVPGYPTRRYAK